MTGPPSSFLLVLCLLFEGGGRRSELRSASLGPRIMMQPGSHPPSISMNSCMIAIFSTQSPQNAERRTQNAERRTQNAERRTQNAERRTMNMNMNMNMNTNNSRPFALDGKASTPGSGKSHAKTFSIGNNAAFSGSTTASDFSSFQSPIVVPEGTTSGKSVATLTLPPKRKTRNPWTTQVRGNASNNTIPPIMCSETQLLTLPFFFIHRTTAISSKSLVSVEWTTFCRGRKLRQS
jgi:hypothetical protein